VVPFLIAETVFDQAHIEKRNTMVSRKSIVTLVSIFMVGLTMGCSAHSSDSKTMGEIPMAPCPGSPNCVSSINPEDKHFIEPLSYSETLDSAYRKLTAILASEPRARIVAGQANYIRAEFKSGVFGFVDDVEFYFSSDQPVIHVRSASRKGYYDFGVNRRRIEGIRKLFNQSLMK
jgi:uncharacterized protein (DUF1499 family)